MFRTILLRLPRRVPTLQCRQIHAEKTLYEILNVEKNATDDVIRSAFLDLSKKYHPDTSKSTNAAENAAQFRELMEAYRVLSNEQLRIVYDGQIRVHSILKGEFEEYEDYDMARRHERNQANSNERYSESGRVYGERRYEEPTEEDATAKPKPDESLHIFGDSQNDFFIPFLIVSVLCVIGLTGMGYYRDYKYAQRGTASHLNSRVNAHETKETQ